MKNENKLRFIFEYFILVILVIAIWACMEAAGKLNPVILPAPLTVLKTFFSLLLDGGLIQNIIVSVVRVLKGYALAMILGLICGVFIGLYDRVKRVTELIIQIVKPIPPIAWIPLVILWFGIGESGKVFLIFLGGFFTMLVNVTDGIHQVDPKLIEVSKAAEIPFVKSVFKVIIPGAAPNIFTGLRVGMSSSWMCVVAAELVSSTTGLGYMIMNARQYGQTDVVIVGMLVIGIIGKILDTILMKIERKVIKWV